MKTISLLGLAMVVGTATYAQTKPTSINVRTAGDLALACSAKPNSPGNAAMLNFCNGFAQGVLQMEAQGGSKLCFPKPPPKRSETMKEFSDWVSADKARQKEVAGVAFVRFMREKFPCKP